MTVRFIIPMTDLKSRGHRKFDCDFTFDGCGIQSGYDLINWFIRCVKAAKDNGFMAHTSEAKCMGDGGKNCVDNCPYLDYDVDAGLICELIGVEK